MHLRRQRSCRCLALLIQNIITTGETLLRLLVSLFTVVSLAGVVCNCATTPDVGSMHGRSFVGSSGQTLRYRLFIPDMQISEGRYPLVIFLHGGTGQGVDNISQVSGANRSGSQVWIQPRNQARHPCFVLAPQLPKGWRWDAVGRNRSFIYAEALVELLAALKSEFPIDEDRVYLTGQSLGGWGTWDISARYAGLFAAAVPVCGGGDPSAVDDLRSIPVWAFHGRLDSQVPVERSRKMVAALRAAGGTVRYTEYATLGHDVWTRAYAEADLPDWLFSQQRTK
jgi:predicted peptidase